jgi:hypothetical protein
VPNKLEDSHNARQAELRVVHNVKAAIIHQGKFANSQRDSRSMRSMVDVKPFSGWSGTRSETEVECLADKCNLRNVM